MSTETFDGKTSFNEPIFRHVKSLSILRQGASNTLKAILIPAPTVKLPSLQKRQSSLIRQNCDLQVRLSNSSRSRSSLFGDGQKVRCALLPNGTWAHIPFDWLAMLTSIIDVINLAIQEDDIEILHRLQESQKELYTKLTAVFPSYVNNKFSINSKIKESDAEVNFKKISSFANQATNRSVVEGEETEIPQTEQWYRSRASHFFPYATERKVDSLNELLDCMMSLPSSSQRSVRALSGNIDKLPNETDDEFSDSFSVTPLIPFCNTVERNRSFITLLGSKTEYGEHFTDIVSKETVDDFDDSDYSEFNIKYVKPVLPDSSEESTDNKVNVISESTEFGHDVFRDSLNEIEKQMIFESFESFTSNDIELKYAPPSNSTLFQNVVKPEFEHKKMDILIRNNDLPEKINPISNKNGKVRTKIPEKNNALFKKRANTNKSDSSKIENRTGKSNDISENVVVNKVREKDINEQLGTEMSDITRSIGRTKKALKMEAQVIEKFEKEKERNNTEDKQANGNEGKQVNVQISIVNDEILEEQNKSKSLQQSDKTHVTEEYNTKKTKNDRENMSTKDQRVNNKILKLQDNERRETLIQAHDSGKMGRKPHFNRRPFSVLKDYSNSTSLSFNDIILLKSINQYDSVMSNKTSLLIKKRYKLKPKIRGHTIINNDVKMPKDGLKMKYFHLFNPKIIPAKKEK